MLILINSFVEIYDYVLITKQFNSLHLLFHLIPLYWALSVNRAEAYNLNGSSRITSWTPIWIM